MFDVLFRRFPCDKTFFANLVFFRLKKYVCPQFHRAKFLSKVYFSASFHFTNSKWSQRI